MRRHPDEVRRFLNQAVGRWDLRWEHAGVTWQVTLAHTHGDVVALAVWCSESGYVAYREELAADLLRHLGIRPRESLPQRLQRALVSLRRWLQRE